MVLYTADLHFGHANVVRMDHRPFADVGEMNEYLIKRWNDRVQNNDDVYIVGDFWYKGAKLPQDILRRLKGRKHLIVGNHDGKLLKNSTAMSYFETVNDLLTITDGDKQVVLCHYPLAEWPRYYRNAYHVYGHIHNNKNQAYYTMAKEDRALNAGCMLNNYTPASLQELIRNNKIFQEEDRKGMG